MRTFVVIPPAALPVSWEEMRAHLRMENDDERQSYVMSLAAAVVEHLDGAEGWLGRALAVQTLETRLDMLPSCEIPLSYEPIIDIVSVKYVDQAGVEHTIDPAGYRLLNASLLPVVGSYWQPAFWGREAVRVRYVAGYAPTDGEVPVSTVPVGIRVAIGMMTKSMFEGQTIQQALEGPPLALLNTKRLYV